jgi:hypothetical protein
MQINSNADHAPTLRGAAQCELALPKAVCRTTDAGVIVLGGGFRLPAVRRDQVADRGAIVLGGGFRLPPVRDARVADRGAITLGGGFRLPAKRAGT